MDALLLHKILIWVSAIGLPLLSVHFTKQIFKPSRKFNGKANWWDVVFNVWMAGWMIYSFFSLMSKSFPYYILGMAVDNPPKASYVADTIVTGVYVLLAVTVAICIFRGQKFKAFWQRGNDLCKENLIE